MDLKSKAFDFDFNSIGKWSERILNYFILPIKMARCCHWGKLNQPGRSRKKRKNII